jgi:hypothetical protein
MNNGRHLAVLNMNPGHSVSIVDVEDRVFIYEASTPGCAVIMPVADSDFLQLCGDGTLQLIQLDISGFEENRIRSDIFFNVMEDAIFDRTARSADGWYLITHAGIIYEVASQGSEIIISGGGANVNRCMGANGADATACSANGGTWIDTIGTDGEGLTIKNKRILLQENIVEGKANSVTYEVNRTAGVAGTGQAIKLNNMYTADGYDDSTNTFGVDNTVTVDVASAGTTGAAELFMTHNVKFKELNIDSVQLLHGPSSTSSNMLQGIKMQNVDFTSQLSVSPIP